MTLKQLIEASHFESDMWRIRYKMNPRSGNEVKSKNKMRDILTELEFPFTEDMLNKIYDEPVPEITENVLEEKSVSTRGRKKTRLTNYTITGNFETDTKEIIRLCEEHSGRKWNSNRLKINFQKVKRRDGTSGVKAICSNGKKISNLGDNFNIGSLIKWIKEGV